MDLKSLTQLGRIEKEVEIQGFKFKLHTLSVSEQHNALTGIPDEIKDDAARMIKLQQEVLVQATDAINGESVGKEDLRKTYAELQPKILGKLFTEYSDLMKEQDKILAELKKN